MLSPNSPDEALGKHNINADVFTWVIRDTVELPTLSPALRQTQATLENFSRDPKCAKTSLLNLPLLPQFSEFKWNSLLAGRAINIDHVLVGQYSLTHNEQCTKHVRELEVILGSSKPDKVVNTHGKWLIAWD